jgi:hypothetical protein
MNQIEMEKWKKFIIIILVLIAVIFSFLFLTSPKVEIVNVALGPSVLGGIEYIDIDVKNNGNKGQVNVVVRYQVVREIWEFSETQGQHKSIKLLDKTVLQSIILDSNELKQIRLKLITSAGNYNNPVNGITIETMFGLIKKTYHHPYPSY